MDVLPILDCPGEPEERHWKQDSPNVGKGEPVFGLGFAVVALGELVVDGVDARDEEPDGDEEAEAGTEVEEADLGCGEGVGGRAVDVLHVGEEGVHCGEDDGLEGEC